MVVGYAGTGKSTMLGEARAAWEAEGYQVRGGAVGDRRRAAGGGAGIAPRTCQLEQWGQGREALTARDVLVVDEAGMIGSRQMERLLSAAEAGAKVVLVGDPEQLQAIEAGAAFRAIAEATAARRSPRCAGSARPGSAATRELATGRTGDAIHAYDSHSMVHAAPTREQARDDLIGRWVRDRQASPDKSRIILTLPRRGARAKRGGAWADAGSRRFGR